MATEKQTKKRTRYSRRIKYDRKGWILSLQITPPACGSLDEMAELVTDTIRELALEYARIEQVRSAR